MSASVIMVFASEAAAETFKNWMKAEGGLHLIAYSQTKDPEHGIGKLHLPGGQPDKDNQFTSSAVVDRTMRNRSIVCIPAAGAVDTPQGFTEADEGIRREVIAFRNAASVSVAEYFGGPVLGDVVRKLLAGEKVDMTKDTVELLERFNMAFPGIAVTLDSSPIWNVKSATPAEFKERYKDYTFFVAWTGLPGGPKPVPLVKGWDQLSDIVAALSNRDGLLPLDNIVRQLEDYNNWKQVDPNPEIDALGISISLDDKIGGAALLVGAAKTGTGSAYAATDVMHPDTRHMITLAVYQDTSGVGDAWQAVDVDTIPENILQEIDTEIRERGHIALEHFVTSDGSHYKWCPEVAA